METAHGRGKNYGQAGHSDGSPVILSAAKNLGGSVRAGQILRCAQNDGMRGSG
jgi:hypothetical protein